jgi:alanine dehydrogenase
VPDVLVLSAADVERALDLDALLDALGDGFMALSAGEVDAPDRNGLTTDRGFMLAMPAWRRGGPVAVKLVSVFEENDPAIVPTHQALICLLDEEDGRVRTVMDGTYVTAVRTNGAASLSARLLARPDAAVLAIVGAGVQGEVALRMFPRVRPIREVRIASKRLEDAERLAARDPRARAVADAEAAVRGADMVALSTASPEPVAQPAWIAPGAHVTSVGYAPPGGELHPGILDRGRLFVETRLAFEAPPVGCAELAGRDPAAAAELGEVLAGLRPGRRGAAEITVYKAMGHAMEDMVAARMADAGARAAGLGRTLPL